MIDLKNFKKIESGKDCTILKHENGHEIKIAHKGLSDSHKKELEKMPIYASGGGRLGGQRGAHRRKIGNPQVYSHPPGRGVGDEASKISQASAPSKGVGFTEPSDMGTNPPVSPSGGKTVYPPCINPSCKSFGHSHPNCNCYGGNEYAVSRYAEGGGVESFCSKNQPHKNTCEYYAEGTHDAPVGEDQSAPPNLDTMSVDESALSPEDQQAPVEPPQDQAQTQQQPQSAAQDPTQITPNQDPATMDPYAVLNQKSDAVNQILHQDFNNYVSDVDAGHIEPKTMHQLFADKSLPGKIGTLFGIIVGGAGAGLTHSDNAALTMMQKQINNDLEAQEKNQSNRTNIMSINGKNLTDLASAGKMGTDIRQAQIAMSQAQANYYLYNQLAQQAANITDPKQAQKAQQALALMRDLMQKQNASAFAQAAGANALGSMLRGGGNTTMMKTGLFGNELAEYGTDKEHKELPGILSSSANRPLSEEDRKTLINKQAYDKAAQQYIDYANQFKDNWKNLNPKQRAEISARGAAMGQDLKAKFQASKPAATADELNKLNKIIADQPAKWTAGFNAIPKVQQTITDSQIEANTLAKSYGTNYIPGNRQHASTYSNKSSAQYPEGTKAKKKDGTPVIWKGGQWVHQ